MRQSLYKTPVGASLSLCFSACFPICIPVQPETLSQKHPSSCWSERGERGETEAGDQCCRCSDALPYITQGHPSCSKRFSHCDSGPPHVPPSLCFSVQEDKGFHMSLFHPTDTSGCPVRPSLFLLTYTSLFFLLISSLPALLLGGSPPHPINYITQVLISGSAFGGSLMKTAMEEAEAMVQRRDNHVNPERDCEGGENRLNKQKGWDLATD